MTRTLSTVLALAIACAPLPALAAAPPRVQLEIDVSELPAGDVTNALQAYLVEEETRTLADGGVEVAADAPMTIRVTVSRYGEGDVNYKARIVLIPSDSATSDVERVITCDLCRDGDLVMKVSEEVARLSGRVLYAPREPVARKPEPEQTSGQQGDPEATTARQKPRKLGPLGAIGIASAVVGLGATGAGIPLAIALDQTRPAASGVERRTTRPAGLALVGVGTALVVTGVVLVAVDVVRRKKARRVSVLPGLGPSSVTVSLSMRF